MGHLKVISQKQRIRPFGADFSLGGFQVSFTKVYLNRDFFKKACQIGAFM